MGYFCLKCHQVYDDSIQQITPIKYKNENGIYDEWRMCPKENCYGKIIEVDELILPTIMELNKKGYETDYCCSGHICEKDTNTYIKFKKDNAPKSIINNFVMEGKNPLIIRKKYDNNMPLTNKFKDIMQTNCDLYEWSKQLDYNNKNMKRR